MSGKTVMVMATNSENPKLEQKPPSNMEKDPEDWVSGNDPMTGAQASYLKTLCEQVKRPEAFEAGLTKAEASKRIDALKADILSSKSQHE